MDTTPKMKIAAMDNFKKEFRNLEMRVHASLRDKIEKSAYDSKHISYCKAIKVHISDFNYTELAIINNALTFLDADGYHYSIFTVSLESLIDELQILKD